MRFCSIASGSSGNCIYVSSDTTTLLVDMGISAKRVTEGLGTLDRKPEEVEGILITHEHSDHIAGLRVFSKKYHIPIYGTAKTLEAIKRTDTKNEIDEVLYREICPDESFILKDIKISPMSVSHDAADPVAYRLALGKKKLGIITDLGEYNDYTVECLKGMDALFVEANHDVRMLELGPYPYPLKQRILGKRGHLSNEASGQLISALAHDGLSTIVLGHLSKENNLPDLAFETVRVEIGLSDNPYKAEDFRISVAKRSEVSEINII